MEKALTAAGRVRRRFKAGRPAKILNVRMTSVQAMHRLVTEADKARNLMRDEELDPEDIHGALIYVAPETPGLESVVRYRWLPAPAQMADFFSAITETEKTQALLFLGILWFQLDREAQSGEEAITWVTQFLAGPKAEEMLTIARDHFRAGGNQTLDN